MPLPPQKFVVHVSINGDRKSSTTEVAVSSGIMLEPSYNINRFKRQFSVRLTPRSRGGMMFGTGCLVWFVLTSGGGGCCWGGGGSLPGGGNLEEGCWLGGTTAIFSFICCDWRSFFSSTSFISSLRSSSRSLRSPRSRSASSAGDSSCTIHSKSWVPRLGFNV